LINVLIFRVAVCFERASHRLPASALAPFNKHGGLIVTLAVTYQSIADELYAAHDKAVDATAVEAAYGAVCQRIFEDIRAAGFASASVSIADKTNLRANPLVSSILTKLHFISLSSGLYHSPLPLILTLHVLWMLSCGTGVGCCGGAGGDGAGPRGGLPQRALRQARAVRAGLRAVPPRLLQQRYERDCGDEIVIVSGRGLIFLLFSFSFPLY
jgi:hypothetical protein